jgi:hypothetical protein
MGTHKKIKSRPFVMVYKDMLNSEAWEELTSASRVAYLHLKSKCVSKDQDDVTLSFDEGERLMNRNTFSRSIKQLAKFGFIIKTQTGGLFRKRNHYQFSEGWRTFKRGTVTRKINSSSDIDTTDSIETNTVGLVRYGLTVSKPIPVKAL